MKVIAVLAVLAAATTCRAADVPLLAAVNQALSVTATPQDAYSTPAPVTGVTNAATVQAIQQAPPAAGGFSADTLGADFQPTPMAAIGAALRALNPRGKVFIDIGCGFDCRAGIVAVRDFGALRVIAIEIDPAIADSARRYVNHAGLQDKIEVITADAADVEFPAGAVGFGYLWPETLAQLAPKIANLDAFASFAHEIPGLPTQQAGDVFVYQRQQPQQVARVPVYANVRGSATWNGRNYSHPVCNRAGCSMCAAIRRQLASTSRQVVGYKTVPIAPNVNSAPAVAPKPQQGAQRQRVAYQVRVAYDTGRKKKVCHGTWCEMVPIMGYRTETRYRYE